MSRAVLDEVAGAHQCLNCGEALQGAYCVHCGQRDLEPRLSVRDFFHELVAEHFGLDSKVARTLLALIRHPGRLTTEFLAGRRVRYVPPLRLYLSVTVLFFLVAALTPSRGQVRVTRGGAAAVRRDTVRASATPRGTGDAAEEQWVRARKTGNTTEERWIRDTLHSNIAVRLFKRRTGERLHEFSTNGGSAAREFGAAFFHHLPDALFLLVPALAAMLMVLYHGQHRYYAEHLVFALHLQAFVFTALFLALLPVPGIQLLLVVVIAVYAFIALRTVYAEGRVRTAAKLGVLGAGYFFGLIVIMTILGLVVFLFG